MRFRLLLAFLAAFAALTAQENPIPPAPAVAPLTLEDCIAQALAKNYDLRIQRTGPLNAREDIITADSAYDPNFRLSSYTGYTQSLPSSITTDTGQVIVSTNPTNDAQNNSLDVTQPLSTGATVTVSAGLNRNDVAPARNSINPAYTGDFALNVRQPVLRGAGRTYNLAAINRAKLGLTRARADFKTSVLTTIREVERAYFNLASSLEELEVRRFSLTVAEKLRDENTTRRDTGVLTDLDVLEAEVEVARTRQNLLTTEQSLRDREDVLVALISPDDFSQPLGPIALPAYDIPPSSAQNSFQLARLNYPALISSTLSIEQFRLDAYKAKSNARLDLAVEGDLRYNSRDRSYTTAFDRIWEREGYNWQLGLVLNYPWGRRGDKARERIANNNLSREELRLLQVEQNLLVDVRAAARSVETNREKVAIATLSTQLSEKRYEQEKSRYDAGVSTFRRVQEAKEDYDNARVTEVQARITLRQAYADLSRLEATTTLARYKVTLQD